MSALFSDTHPEVEALQIALWRQAGPTRKMTMLAQLNASARTLALAGLRARYPRADEAELRFKLASLLLGEDLARKVHGGSLMQSQPLEVTLKVTGVLEALGVPYLIGGSLASTLYGMVRTTQDADIVAEMRLEHLSAFVVALQDEFYVDDEMIAEAIRRRSSFNIIHRETMFKVDVFIPSPRPFLQSQLARAKRQTFADEVGAMFASPEDVILSKLEWYRLGGEVSERQWRDVIGVLKVCAGDLDLNYLRKWAAELNVGDLLERALQTIE